MKFRKKVRQSDVSDLKEILESSGFFYDSEVEIAQELAQENLEKGEEKSGYIFNIVEIDEKPVGFTCYGKIPGTADSFDLYWIAIHQSQRRKGLGKILMNMALDDISKMRGRNIWIETSSRPIYEPTRMFYLSTGSEEIAQLPDYYGAGDNKVIFLKKI
jgi:ribosomal protein S18 acetylase RimI-like enzyme